MLLLNITENPGMVYVLAPTKPGTLVLASRFVILLNLGNSETLRAGI